MLGKLITFVPFVMFCLPTYLQSTEVCALYQSVRCGEAREAGAAVAGLVSLAKQDKIHTVTLLTNLLADVISAVCPAPTVQAITQLMLLMGETDWPEKQTTNLDNNKTANNKLKKESFVNKNGNNKNKSANSKLNSNSKKHYNQARENFQENLNDENESEKKLINPFTGPPNGPVSPYVTLVRKKPELAPLVVEECGYLLYHQDNR